MRSLDCDGVTLVRERRQLGSGELLDQPVTVDLPTAFDGAELIGVASAGSGKFVVTGRKDTEPFASAECVLTLIGSNGSVLGTATESFTHAESCWTESPVGRVVVDQVNGIVTLAGHQHFDEINNDQILVKFFDDESLQLLNTVVVPGVPGVSEYLKGMAAHPDGGISLLTQTDSFTENSYVTLHRVTPTGDLISTRIDKSINYGIPCTVDRERTAAVLNPWLFDGGTWHLVENGVLKNPPTAFYWTLGQCLSQGEGLVQLLSLASTANGALFTVDATGNIVHQLELPRAGIFTNFRMLGASEKSFVATWTENNTSIGVQEIAWATGGDTTPDCQFGEVTVVSARGSGELGVNDGVASVEDAGSRGLAIFVALDGAVDPSVDVDLIGVDYPAVSVGELWKLWQGHIGQYLDSVRVGVESLLGTLGDIAEACGPDHPVVLVGFSQGAHVVQLALEVIADDPASLLHDLPVTVGLMASPMFTWGDVSARGTFPWGATGLASNPLFVGEFSTAPIRAEFADVTRTWCLANDPVCDLNVGNLTARNRAVHTGPGYVTADVPDHSALDDIVNTALWALAKRGVMMPAPPDPPLAIGSPRAGVVTSRLIACPRGQTGFNVTADLSAANITSNDRAVFLHRWDLNNDGVDDVIAPIVRHTFESCFPRGTPASWTIQLKVSGSDGLNQLIPVTVTRR